MSRNPYSCNDALPTPPPMRSPRGDVPLRRPEKPTVPDRHRIQSHTVRLPEDLKQALLDEAQKKDSTLNAEIVERLQNSFGAVGPTFASSEEAEQWARQTARDAYSVCRQPLGYIKVLERENVLTVTASKSLADDDTSPPVAIVFTKEDDGMWVCRHLLISLINQL